MRRPLLLLCAALLLPSAGWPGAGEKGLCRDLEVVETEVPAWLATAAAVAVPVTLRNDGDDTWSPAAGYAVSYHWLGEDGATVILDGARTLLPGPVLPGETARVSARVVAPGRPGRYRLQWDVVQEHVCWLSQRDPSPPAPVDVEVRSSHAVTVLGRGTPAWLWSGATATVRLELRNDGLKAWTPDGPVRLSNHWYARAGEVVTWDGPRTALPASVEAGGTVTVDGTLMAPSAGGRYLVQWDLVEEGECWFAERDPSPEPLLPVLVLPAPAWSSVLLVGLALVGVPVLAWATSRGGGRAAPFLARADLVWLGASLLLKQGVVLEATGQGSGAGEAWLVAGGVAMVVALLLLLPRTGRPWVVWVAAVGASGLFLADVVYLRYFGDLLSIPALGAAGQMSELGESVRSLLHWRDLWLVADLVPGLLLVTFVARLERSLRSGRVRVVALALLALALPAAAFGRRRVPVAEGVLRQVFRGVLVAREVGVLQFHALDGERAVSRLLLRGRVTDADLGRLTGFFRERASRRAGIGPSFGRARGRNLLMIQVESLQAFMVGYRVGGQEVTPTLNRLAAESLHLSVADQTDQGRSSDCELATQVSLLPAPAGAAAFLFSGNDFTGLAEILAGRGYATLSAVPFEGSFWNRRVTHAAFGFSRSLFDHDFAPGEVIGWGLNDRAFVGQMLPRLEASEHPFCAYLITLSLHHPFVGFPDHLKELDVGAWEGSPFGNYLHTMRFFDHALSDLLAGLEARGLLEETVLAVWGDHDAGLGWDQETAAAIGTRWHEPDWYVTERVPLLIRVPGAPELRGRLALAAGQVDVAPTLLALLGVDPAPYPFVGRNLLGEPGDGPVPGAYGSFVDSRYLFVPRGATLAEGHCYELATLERVSPDACRGAYEEAMRQAEASRLVLEHDLQQRLCSALAAEGDAP